LSYWIDGKKKTPTAPWLFSNGKEMLSLPGLQAGKSGGLGNRCVYLKKTKIKLNKDNCTNGRRVICEF